MVKEMKKIYITGIAGLLGVNLALELKSKFCVSGVDLFNIKLKDITVDVYDMLDFGRLKENIKNKNIDVVIHTAAAINVDLCEEKPEYARNLNVCLTKEIADICTENNIKLIYISTDAVFDGGNNSLYTEIDPVNPINIYGKTKYEGEQYVLKNQENFVLRTNIYGFNTQHKKSFGEWILDSLINDQTINLFEDIYFSPILVNELSKIIALIIENNICGLYHVCGTGSVSKYEFGIELKKKFGIKSGLIIKEKSENHHFVAKRAKNMGMSNEKICKLLDIHISTPVQSIKLFKELYDKEYPQMLKGMGDR